MGQCRLHKVHWRNDERRDEEFDCDSCQKLTELFGETPEQIEMEKEDVDDPPMSLCKTRQSPRLDKGVDLPYM